jgi:hypothetical protein
MHLMQALQMSMAAMTFAIAAPLVLKAFLFR